MLEDYGVVISQFEDLLKKITESTTTGLIFERLHPPEIWKRSGNEVTSLQRIAEQLRDFMLDLKPEKSPTITEFAHATLQPLLNFREILFKEPQDITNSRLALEELRGALVKGSRLLELAQEIHDNPSEGIKTILKLREIYDAKEYLSAIPIPETTYIEFIGLKKNIENLKLSVTSLETTIKGLKINLDQVMKEISRYRSVKVDEDTEKSINKEIPSKNKTGIESALVTEE